MNSVTTQDSVSPCSCGSEGSAPRIEVKVLEPWGTDRLELTLKQIFEWGLDPHRDMLVAKREIKDAEDYYMEANVDIYLHLSFPYSIIYELRRREIKSAEDYFPREVFTLYWLSMSEVEKLLKPATDRSDCYLFDELNVQLVRTIFPELNIECTH